MKTRKTILALIATLCALSSCTKQEELTPAPAGKTELRLMSGIATRALPADLQNEQIIAGQTVYAWVDAAASPAAPHLQAWLLEANGSGVLDPVRVSSSDDGSRYYPETAPMVNIYAMHGNFGSAITKDMAFPTTAITHTVAANQTTAAAYATSDLLYAATLNQPRIATAVELKFYHLLSKVEVALTRGAGIKGTDLAGITVRIIGTRTAVNFTPSKTVNMTDKAARTSMIPPAGRTEPIEIGRDTTTNFNSATPRVWNQAVVVPQVLPANTAFIEVSGIQIDGKATTLHCPLTTTFESGMKYQYEVTVTREGLTIEAKQIINWDSAPPITPGDARVQRVATYNATDLKPGDYYYSDGNYSDGGLRKRYRDGRIEIENPKPTPTSGKTVIGIVFQTDPNRIGQAEYNALVAKGVTPKGLVMALQNASTRSKWGDDGNAGLRKCSTKKRCYEDISGLDNMKKAHGGDLNKLAAFAVASAYTPKPNDDVKTTGWFLPSIGQWWDIIQNLGGCLPLADRTEQTNTTVSGNPSVRYSNAAIFNNLNGWVSKINAGARDEFRMATSEYWSSSEVELTNNRYYSKSIEFYSNDWFYLDYGEKSTPLAVRAILAF